MWEIKKQINKNKKQLKIMSKIKQKMIEILCSYPNGLDTRQISELSDIRLTSLTNPIKMLLDDGFIEVSGFHKSTVSNRNVLVYKYIKIPNDGIYLCIKSIFLYTFDDKIKETLFKKGKKYYSDTLFTITDEFGIEHDDDSLVDWRDFFKLI